jgi:4-carboxymuconolactone decarboxylase
MEVYTMRISDTAEKNHEALFPNHKSTLKVTDPELIEIFDNFAFDEVLQYGELDIKLRMKVILAAMISMQTLSEYKVMTEAALNVGVTPIEIKEIVYQSVPYCGIAKVFDFIHATNEIFTSRGIKLPLEGQSTTKPDNRLEEGLKIQKEIIGAEVIDKMYENSPESQIHIQKYLSGNCFGDYYTRKGLDVKTRELLTFSMLIAMGGCEPQAEGHIMANLHVGNDKQLLLTVVTNLLPYIGYPRTLSAISYLNEIIPESK